MATKRAKDKSLGKELVKKKEDRNHEVKSMVVVKHSTVPESPAFSILQPYTNLNVPPSNWLRNSSRMEKNIFDFTWQKKEHPEFSSIEMANNSLDITGEVDVISNSNNIKKLLKMPYSKGHISMMVHRIGKTLLIDEFDVHKHLLRQQQDDWKWLREFYYQSVAKEMQIKCVPKKNKSRDTLKNRNMLSKFLYRSLADSNETDEENLQQTSQEIQPENVNLMRAEQYETPGFHREVLWTFEDIRMLIGTDLPIFGDKNCPCISLRLRDMKTPINVLTGLDYWLDNLMSNVPEVAMCYHLNGIVQKYELIKTEDIPNMKNSEFDPKMMVDVARNILAFLKSNATKEGHTYWLYKGVDDDVVKLYDLTALCANNVNDSPFTVPLGMLLYRVARNLWQNECRKKRATIRTLLENCLILLDEEKHSQVYTSACYLLSDIFIPESAINDVWEDTSDDSGADSEQSEPEEDSTNNTTTIDVKALCVKSHGYSKTREFVHTKCMAENVQERCNITLQYIAKGLKSLDKDFTILTRKQTHLVEEQRRCYSYEAIPLYYEPLKKSAPPFDDNHTPLHNLEHLQVSETSSSRTWHRLSKVLLLRKAAITFFSIAKAYFADQNLAYSLKYIKLALQCFAGKRILLPKRAYGDVGLLVQIMSLTGDIHLMYIHRGVTIETISPEDSEEEIIVMDSVNRELETFEYEWACTVHEDMKARLLLCCQCYSVAIETAQAITTDPQCEPVLSLVKRHGNILNELGVWYMNQAQALLQKQDGIFPKGEFESLCEESCICLQKGMSRFQSIGDKANKALLQSNKGRLYRVKAQEQSQSSRASGKEFSAEERQSYKQAIDCYQKALEILKNRDSYTEIWDSISWELSTTYFNMAMLLQDYAPLSSSSQEEIEKEVATLMNKSLRYCNTETCIQRQPTYTYRAATINHRLASLYHNGLRQQENEHRQKYLKQLAESHYSKAIKYFQAVDCTLELLRVQLEQVALQEYFLTAAQSNNRSKQRTLTLALSHLLSCRDILQKILKQSVDPDFEERSKQEAKKLSDILESRLQFILLQIMKCQSSKKRLVKTEVERTKTLYASSLQLGVGGVKSGLEKLPMLISILDDVREYYEENLIHDLQTGS